MIYVRESLSEESTLVNHDGWSKVNPGPFDASFCSGTGRAGEQSKVSSRSKESSSPSATTSEKDANASSSDFCPVMMLQLHTFSQTLVGRICANMYYARVCTMYNQAKEETTYSMCVCVCALHVFI